jgi:hypothetical protein
LQAAEPEVETSYRPVVEDIQPAPLEDTDEPDVTSEVFSELSSLSSERPKVQKTKAGLAKRRSDGAKPVEVKPIQQEVTLKHADRDADAVRSRFSSFYSGTQRARSDVQEHEHHGQPTSAKD